MKKLYTTLCLFSFLTLAAQKKVDLDRFRFTVHYRALPEIQIDTTYRTYHVEVEATRLMDQFLRDISPENSVLLEGWRKLPQDGHLVIKVKIEDLIPESFSVKERTEQVKTAQGNISTRTHYRQEVVYSFSARASIYDYKGAHIMDESLASRQYKSVYRSPEFTIRHLAEGYFMVNSVSITRDLFNSSVNNAMHTLSNRISDNFGFRAVNSNDVMWIVDSRKHPEYEAHRKAYQQITDVLFEMNANTPITGAREKLKPAIDYFESIKTKYPTTSKHDRKMRYASYFNLAVLYYYLDDPQAMLKEARGLELNDYDAGDAKGFIQTATWLKNLFEKNNIYTRHFPVDISRYKGPYEKETVTKGF